MVRFFVCVFYQTFSHIYNMRAVYRHCVQTSHSAIIIQPPVENETSCYTEAKPDPASIQKPKMIQNKLVFCVAFIFVVFSSLFQCYVQRILLWNNSTHIYINGRKQLRAHNRPATTTHTHTHTSTWNITLEHY